MRWLRKAGSGKRNEREAKTAEGYLHICGQWLQRAGMKAALCLCLFFLPSLFVQAQGRKAEELVVTYHYERYESDYEGFCIWSWIAGEEGKEYAFTQEDSFGSKVEITYPVEGEYPEVGFLVKYKDWEAGEIDVDRFLDLSQAVDGHLDVYILQNEEEVYYRKEDVAKEVRLLRAELDSFSEISISLYRYGGEKDDFSPVFSIQDETGREYRVEEEDFTSSGSLLQGKLTIEALPDLHRQLYILCGKEKEIVRAAGIFDTDTFEEEFCYEGNDLGAVWREGGVSFRLWAPTALAVEVALYTEGTQGRRLGTWPMEQGEGGTWHLDLEGDYAGIYYTYLVEVEGKVNEVADPYAAALGLNGERGMILDWGSVQPESFYEERTVEAGMADVPIVYEMSVRDFTMDQETDFKQRGTYPGAVEAGVKNAFGDKAGLDYLEELDITYVHLLPTQDSSAVDERDVEGSYNWGYMTSHFFVPEGGYSTCPEEGAVRVREYQEMVAAFHRRGIGVVMDVVYNHTADITDFENIVPGYFYRKWEDGSFSNGSACGNETANERKMVRKLIVDSVCHWIENYHVDGFRFDLMGLLDLDTMNEISRKARERNPSVLLYGEGWRGAESCYEGETGMSVNAWKMPGVGVFSNIYRRAGQKYVCGIFQETGGNGRLRSILPDIRFGIVGAVKHPATQEVGRWTITPRQCMNYVSCHDGYTLWDNIRISTPGEAEERQKRRNRFAASLTLTSQGIPFFQAGEEFLRSKTSDGNPDTANSNSYNAGDEINSMKWELVTENRETVDYYRGLIAFRKAHGGIRLENGREVEERLTFLEEIADPAMGYLVRDPVAWWREDVICILHNPAEQEMEAKLPLGIWSIYVDAKRAGTQPLETLWFSEKVRVEGISTLVLIRTGLSRAGWAAIGILLLAGMTAGIGWKKRRKNGK